MSSLPGEAALPFSVPEAFYSQSVMAGLMPGMPLPLSAQASTSTAVAASPSAGQLRKRRFSGAKIQPTRVKKVMQSDEEIGRMVASVPVAIGRAMEHFAEKFLLASAEAVYNSSARTLSPYHMKMAMLANPHFSFLEPILRDVGIPSRSGEVYIQPVPPVLPAPLIAPSSASALPTSSIPSCSSALGIGAALGAGMWMEALTNPNPEIPVGQLLGLTQQRPLIPGGVPLDGTSDPSILTPPAAAPRAWRRSSSNGTPTTPQSDGAVPEKKPRGRPRKIKKDKCVEDNLVMDESMQKSALISSAFTHFTPPESEEKDRVLMPPPALPFGRLPPPS